jgi:hypothetical protein
MTAELLPDTWIVRRDACAVVKQGDPRKLAIEVAKAQSARELALRCGLFRAPKVLDYDATVPTFRLEWLEGFVPIGRAIAYGENGLELVARVAAIASAIHGQMFLPVEFREPLTAAWRVEGEEDVVLHGDFNTNNLLYNEVLDEISLVDWTVSHPLGATGSVGSRYVDLAWFIKGLFFRPKSFVLARDANTCAAKFLQTYQRESGVELRGEILQDVGHRCRRVAMTYRSRKRFRSLLHLAPNRAMGRFLDAKEWVHVGE